MVKCVKILRHSLVNQKGTGGRFVLEEMPMQARSFRHVSIIFQQSRCMQFLFTGTAYSVPDEHTSSASFQSAFSLPTSSRNEEDVAAGLADQSGCDGSVDGLQSVYRPVQSSERPQDPPAHLHSHPPFT